MNDTIPIPELAARVATATGWAGYATLFDTVPSPIVVVDASWRIVYLNGPMADLSGWAPSDGTGRGIVRHVHPDDAGWLAEAFEGLVAAEQSDSGRGHTWTPLRLRMVTRLGASVPVEVDACAALRHPGVAGVVLSVRSVAYEALITHVLAGVASGAPLEGVMVDLATAMVMPPVRLDVAIFDERRNLPRRCLSASTEALGAVDIGDAGFAARTAHLTHPSGRKQVARFAAADLDIVGDHDGDVLYTRCASPDGDHVVHVIGRSPGDRPSAAGAYQRMLAGRELIDIVLTRLTADRMLDRAATHDSLTGLLNRVGLERHAAGLRAAGREFSVLVLDLDGFKSINDAHGHAVGDIVLSAVAERLRRCVRPSDVVARLGGDEFIAVLAGSPARAAAVSERIVERMLAALAEPVSVGALRVQVPASVGIACVNGVNSEAFDATVRRADSAMYVAKRAGGARHHHAA